MMDALRRAMIAAGVDPDAVAAQAATVNLNDDRGVPKSQRRPAPVQTMDEQMGLDVGEPPGVVTIRPGTRKHGSLGMLRNALLEPNQVEWLAEFKAAGLVVGDDSAGWTTSAAGEMAMGMLDAGSIVRAEKGNVVPQAVKFDKQAGEAARDASMAQVDAAADPDWKDAARVAIDKLIAAGDEFTADDVWAVVGFFPKERRALGPILKAYADGGRIVSTGRRKNSERPEHHAFPMAIWRPA